MTMEPTKTDNPIARKVLAAIESGKVHMRPRWHFVLKAALAIAGMIFLTGALVYLISFIIFVMRESGAWYLTPFGLRGLKVFLMAAPWILIIIAAVVFVILEVLVRRYSFAYQRPLLYSIIAVMALITLSSFAVARNSIGVAIGDGGALVVMTA
jgi:hypothetical protein